MIKEFIPYELALELKQLGFNEPCFTYYKNDQLSDILELVKNSEMTNVNNESDDYISAPTYSQAFRWFRKECALESYIRANLFVDVPKSYQFYIDENIDDIWYDTYEEAEIACLKKLSETVRSNTK
jgi:hypothetical protein